MREVEVGLLRHLENLGAGGEAPRSRLRALRMEATTEFAMEGAMGKPNGCALP